MSSGTVDDFLYDFRYKLKAFARKYRIGIDFASDLPPGSLLNQIIDLKPFADPLVLLVDEYDSRLLQNLHDPAVYNAYHVIIYDFFKIVKSNFKDFRFVYFTGVSRFSNTSIFSAFNNLKELSLD